LYGANVGLQVDKSYNIFMNIYTINWKYNILFIGSHTMVSVALLRDGYCTVKAPQSEPARVSSG
jgi:hypothetical protein